jgi:uncharacterized membrane protein YhaH (DUF805 family)
MSETAASISGRTLRREPFGLVALVLAIVFMVPFVGVSIESEMLWGLHRQGRIVLERLVWLLCFLAVLVPLVLSWMRQRRYPDRWRDGRRKRLITASILVFNVVQLLVAWYYDAI